MNDKIYNLYRFQLAIEFEPEYDCNNLVYADGCESAMEDYEWEMVLELMEKYGTKPLNTITGKRSLE